MIKVILYILTLFIVIWGCLFLVAGIFFSSTDNFYALVMVIGSILLLILIFCQMYHLKPPKKMKILWISFFVFLFALSGIYEICKAYKRSVSGDDDFFVPFEDKNVVSLGDVYYNDINID